MGERAPSVVGLKTTENGAMSGGDGHSLSSSDRPLITGISSVAETSRERRTPGRGQNNNPDNLSIPDNRIQSFSPVTLEIINLFLKILIHVNLNSMSAARPVFLPLIV